MDEKTLAIALFLIPGFLFQNSIFNIRTSKEHGNWSFIIPLILWSTIFFIFTKLVIFYAKPLLSKDLVNYLVFFKKETGNIPNFYSLIGSAIVSLLSGILLKKIYNYTKKTTQKDKCNCFKIPKEKLSKFINAILDYTFTKSKDDFIQTYVALSHNLVLLSLTNNSYYIGFLNSFTSDSKDNDKAFSLVPIWSGKGYNSNKLYLASKNKNGLATRIKPNHNSSVIFDTFYGNITRDGDEYNKSLAIVFSFSEIRSIRKFNQQLDRQFRESNKTIYIN